MALGQHWGDIGLMVVLGWPQGAFGVALGLCWFQMGGTGVAVGVASGLCLGSLG